MSAGPRLVAALPMYDFRSTWRANDALWRGIATRLRDAGVPARLTLSRDRPLDKLWRDPNLILGQTCGYPFITALENRVRLIATPVYNFPGCEGAWHCAFLVAAASASGADVAAFRGAAAAINARDSNSGMNLFRAALAPFAGGVPYFSQVIVTGSHEASLRAVAQGKAAIASIDCISFGLLARQEPDLIGAVKIIGRTALSPGLPFIAAAGLPEASYNDVRAALDATLSDSILAPPRAILGLRGVEFLPAAIYGVIAEMERSAVALGYPELA